jgi:predicted small secreted protein
MKQHRVAFWAIIGLFVASTGLAGCNTVRGMGQDVEAAGSGMSGAAQDVQQDMRRRN